MIPEPRDYPCSQDLTPQCVEESVSHSMGCKRPPIFQSPLMGANQSHKPQRQFKSRKIGRLLLTTSGLLVVMESRGSYTRQRTKPTIYGSHILEKQPIALQGGSFALAKEWNSFGNDYDSYRIHSDTFRSRLRDIQMALELFQKPPEFI